ncbi:hypothetical protein vBRpoSV10_93 [Ruegeria phage vB_RpoS-V10]|nr:hypothetical protein DSS3P8_093 [Roseobacter phage DSS3P8]AWY09215.1 hypothetical protein vBRpoSV10_93 [Ruegeria phage vB_RpoS-V10]
MGWNISLLENTAHVPLESRAHVAEACIEHSEAFWSADGLTPSQQIERVFWGTEPNDTLIKFDSDDMEHMDYVTHNTEICRAMAAAGVTGRICFGSLAGDNSGQFWGVEFASGHYRSLTGKVQWTPGTSYPGN